MADLTKIKTCDLHFTTRTRNALLYIGGDNDLTLAMLDGYKDAYLLRLPGFGRICLKEVREAIALAKQGALT